MSDLINRQQAIDVLEEQLDYLFKLDKKDNPTAESKWYGINWTKNMIAELPTAEPKVGRWIDDKCSVCNYGVQPWNNTPYCPRCGAKMKGVEE